MSGRGSGVSYVKPAAWELRTAAGLAADAPLAVKVPVLGMLPIVGLPLGPWPGVVVYDAGTGRTYLAQRGRDGSWTVAR